VITRVAIVAASAVVRAGLEALVAGSPALAVVGAVAEPEVAGGGTLPPLLDAVAALDPDVVLWAPAGDRRAGGAEPASLELVVDRREPGAAPIPARLAPAIVVLADHPDA
jgi:hypothetical protein